MNRRLRTGHTFAALLVVTVVGAGAEVPPGRVKGVER